MEVGGGKCGNLLHSRRTKTKGKASGSLSLKVQCLYNHIELSRVVASLALNCNGVEQVIFGGETVGCLKRPWLFLLICELI